MCVCERDSEWRITSVLHPEMIISVHFSSCCAVTLRNALFTKQKVLKHHQFFWRIVCLLAILCLPDTLTVSKSLSSQKPWRLHCSLWKLLNYFVPIRFWVYLIFPKHLDKWNLLIMYWNILHGWTQTWVWVSKDVAQCFIGFFCLENMSKTVTFRLQSICVNIS